MEMHRTNPTCNVVPPLHGSDRPRARQLRRDRQVAHARERHAARHRAATSTTARRSTSLAELTAALMKRPMPLVRTFTENLMAYALGRRVEYFDQPAIRAIAQGGRGERLQDVVVHPRRRQERCVPDEASGAGQRPTDATKDAGTVAISHTFEETRRCHFITGKQLPRRTFLRGAWAPTVALPFLDAMVPAGTRRQGRRRRRAHPPDLHRGGARPGRLQQVGRDQAPLRAGSRPASNFTIVPDSALTSLEPYRELPDDRQQHRRAHGRSVHRRRKSAATTSARARCS